MSDRREAVRLAEFAEAYERFDPYVTELRSHLTTPEAHFAEPEGVGFATYAGCGNRAATVFKLTIEGQDYALRLPKPDLSEREKDSFSQRYGLALSRVRGIERAEQGVALGERAVISHFVGDESFRSVQKRGGLWLLAKHVINQVATLEEMADNRVVCDRGSDENLRLGPAGFTNIDLQAVRTRFWGEGETEVARFMRTFDWRVPVPIPREQYDELVKIADFFASEYPASPRNNDIERIINIQRIAD